MESTQRELIMQEAHNYDHCIRNSYKWIYRKRQLCKGQTQHLFNSILAHVKILVRRGQHVNQGMLLVGLVVQAWQLHVCYRFGKWEAS
jgi:hypothetical protein